MDDYYNEHVSWVLSHGFGKAKAHKVIFWVIKRLYFSKIRGRGKADTGCRASGKSFTYFGD
jgi:hypothetical protein